MSRPPQSQATAKLQVLTAAGKPWRVTRQIGSFQDFRRWCNARRLACLPASSRTVELYVRSQSRCSSYDELIRIMRAIRRPHRQLGFVDPTESTDVIAALDSLLAKSISAPNEAIDTSI